MLIKNNDVCASLCGKAAVELEIRNKKYAMVHPTN